MRNNRSFAAALAGVLGFVALIGWSMPSTAQAPGPSSNPPGDINPQLANCNTTPDVMKDPSGKIVPTPIVPGLLTSGQPCAQVVTTNGLVPNDGLANLQRGFDFYSWLTFIALNSPADGKPIGKGPRPGGDALTLWESVGNYRPLVDVMLPGGAKPTWGTRNVPDACKPLDGPGKIVVEVIEEAWNQPFKTGPLIDQNGNYALFDILMNKVMFDYIVTNNLYSKEGQAASQLAQIEFPEGVNLDTTKNPGPGKMGAVMVKVSWRVLDPVKDQAVMNTFHTADALVYFPGPPHTKAPQTCVAKKLGLIGFHVGHKTKFAPQWVWTSFEHIANVPDQAAVKSKNFLPRYSFYKKGCDLKQCPVNVTPPDPWDPPATLQFHNNYRSQIVRADTLPPLTAADVKELNTKFRAILKGTVWENYILLATQWPTDFRNPVDLTGVPAPTYLANTTLETYSQGIVPLASSSCMACHGNATDQHVPAKASDFTFILEKAQSTTASK